MSKRYFRISSCFIKDYLSFCNGLFKKRIANRSHFYEIDGHPKDPLEVFHKTEVVISMLDRRHRLEFNN